jgi:HPt (histidine-containing phosphotransfer) domain-containing protein
MPLSTLMAAASQRMVAGSINVSDVCQMSTLIERCLGDAALAARLWKRFDERLPKTIAQIEAALSEDNRAEAQQRVHSLKGEAASLAALRLQDAATELERHLKSEAEDADSNIARSLLAVRTAAERCRECVPLILDALATSAATSTATVDSA